MAYVVDLEEEAQNDVPVTLLRSTAEVINDKSEQNISANNIIINVSIINSILCLFLEISGCVIVSSS